MSTSRENAGANANTAGKSRRPTGMTSTNCARCGDDLTKDRDRYHGPNGIYCGACVLEILAEWEQRLSESINYELVDQSISQVISVEFQERLRDKPEWQLKQALALEYDLYSIESSGRLADGRLAVFGERMICFDPVED